MKQQSEMKKLKVRAKRRPNISIVDVYMPSGGIRDIPSCFAFNEAKIGFSLVASTSSVSGGAVSSHPTVALSTPVKSLSIHRLGRRGISKRGHFLPIRSASVSTVFPRFRTFARPMPRCVAVVTNARLGATTFLLDQGKDFRLGAFPDGCVRCPMS
jgi:hypothetical protein